MSDDVDLMPAPSLARRAGLLATLCGVGGLSALLFVPEPEAHAAQAVQIALAGTPVEPVAEPRLQAHALSQRYLGGRVTLRAPGVELQVRRADLGAGIDVAHLDALLERAHDPSSSLRRVHDRTAGQRALDLPMPARLDTEVATALLLRIKDRVDRDPSDARLEPRTKQAIPAQAGVALDVYASLERLDRALVRGDAEVQLATHMLPARIGANRYEHVAMKAVLGEFSTRYARGQDAVDRIHNLRVAAERVHGHVVEPGQVFDFNEVVGDRTSLHGFRKAKVIAGGELVDGVGGGTCQIASTLHAAVYFAGLPIVTRHAHSLPSYYIKLGLDAAVAYGSLNFRFKNDRPYPIVLETTVADGYVHAAVHGPERTHTVTFLRRVDEVSPFEEKIEQDPALPRGTRLLQQRGVPGFKITRLRVIHDERTRVAVRERGTDTYPPTTQIWRIGTGPEAGPDFKPPKNDGRPEYVADEFMSATQGPHTDGIEVDATPGRTGAYGWTERERMMRPARGGA
jgi:vancomycin resistance protein YoaR